MIKAALLALPYCVLEDISPLLQHIAHREWRLRVLSFDGLPTTTGEGLRIQADASLQNAVPLDLNLCVVPGGHYRSDTWEDLRLHRFLRQFDGRRGWIAASCEGVVCLASAQLLGGVKYSAPATMVEKHQHMLRIALHTAQSVTVDSNIVSSDGSNSWQFAEEVLRRIEIGHENAPS